VQKISLYIVLVAAVLAMSASAVTAAPVGLTVTNARMPLPPSGSDVGAVYLTLHNEGTDSKTIVAVESPSARSAMLHKSMVVQGTERMRPIERLTIAAGREIVLAPGGLHIMLVGLKADLRVGQEVPLVLRLEGGQKVEVMVPVRPIGTQ